MSILQRLDLLLLNSITATLSIADTSKTHIGFELRLRTSGNAFTISDKSKMIGIDDVAPRVRYQAMEP